MKRLAAIACLIGASGLQAADCARCHAAQTRSFTHAQMTRALESVAECEILRTNTKLSGKVSGYSYEITREGDRSIYSVTDGKDTLRVPLEWAFGLGVAGQTYLYRRDGVWYESRVSYYSAIRGLDTTMGAQGRPIQTLEEAAGSRTGDAEAGQCFNCHATNAIKGTELTLARMRPGIQCERCHGDTQNHPTAAMKPLGKLTSEETSDFCGQCHRTWSQIAINGPQGINNIRFQPYRLTNSKCYSPDDKRIACTACHDPHQALQTSAAAYDKKCEVCHAAPAKVCTVAKKDCVSCHMPKIELPGAHNRFTDHMIRVAKSNEKYPN